MSRTNLRAHVTLALAASLATLIPGCDRPAEVKAGDTSKSATPVAKVEVVRPERYAVRRAVGQPGQLVAFETTEIHARIPGYVKAWAANIGDAVKKGQVLAELSVPELDAELQQKRAAVEQATARRKQADAGVEVAEANVAGASASLDEARAGVARAEADLERWQAEHRRVERLFQERAQTGSLLDETRSKLRSSEASRQEVLSHVKTAEVALGQARAALDQARADVAAAAAAIAVAREEASRAGAMAGYARIEAPYDGIVTRRLVHTGQLTKPGADSEPLFVVARSDVVTITIDVPEAYASDVNPGDRATVELRGTSSPPIEAKVTRTSWALDPKTRTIRVEVDIPNPEGRLRPGLYAYATVVAEEHADALTVPATALVRDKDRAWCVAVVDRKAVRRPVEVGLSDGTRAEILSGLRSDETVVKANAASLADGQPVEPTEPKP
jgi:RND family efflux transporter MFP subunit